MESRPAPPAPDSPLRKLMSTLPRAGRVEWIGLRPARAERMREVDSVEASAGGAVEAL